MGGRLGFSGWECSVGRRLLVDSLELRVFCSLHRLRVAKVYVMSVPGRKQIVTRGYGSLHPKPLRP